MSEVNKSGILPLEFKVLIRPDAVEKTSKGGIILPESTREKEQAACVRGTMVAMSPYAFQDFEDAKPGVGDAVLIAKYGGQVHTGADGVEYRLLNDKDVIAILEGV